MLFFNKSKVLFICLFTMVMGSHVAYGNIEFSGHFGKKLGGKVSISNAVISLNTVQKNQPWHLGADVFYRNPMQDASLGLGLRYRFDFQGEKEAESNDITGKYKFTTHRIAFLTNYRFLMDQFFVGAIFGLDIWKSVKFPEDFGNGVSVGGTNVKKMETRSNQFLWDQLTGQLGVEFGFMPTSNFLFKLEAGYDLFSFTDLEVEYDGTDREVPDDNKMNLNGFYITLGVGVFFG